MCVVLSKDRGELSLFPFSFRGFFTRQSLSQIIYPMEGSMLARVLAITYLLVLTACAGAITTGPDGNSPPTIHLRTAAHQLDSIHE